MGQGCLEAEGWWGLVTFLHEDLIFFELTLSEEASCALDMEPRCLRGGILDLERWNPESRCIKSKNRAKEAWIGVVRLPLHLWTREILKLIGEECGGLISINKEMTLHIEVAWAKLLVSLKGEIQPRWERSYELQLWWKMQLWEARVFPMRRDLGVGKSKPKVEDDPTTRASQCAWSKVEEGGRRGRSGMSEE